MLWKTVNSFFKNLNRGPVLKLTKLTFYLQEPEVPVWPAPPPIQPSTCGLQKQWRLDQTLGLLPSHGRPAGRFRHQIGSAPLLPPCGNYNMGWKIYLSFSPLYKSTFHLKINYAFRQICQQILYYIWKQFLLKATYYIISKIYVLRCLIILLFFWHWFIFEFIHKWH